MAGKKGIKAAEAMRKRQADKRGGNERKPDGFNREAPDALGNWQDDYLTSLAVHNYSPRTVEQRRDALKVFITWAQERDLIRAGEITRPILESYQRWLWRYRKADGKPMSIALQRARLSTLKDWFRWLVRQNVLLSNPASEIDLPRREKRIPVEGMSLQEVEAVLAVPNLSDPLGVRDRAMLETLYSCGIRRSELCRLEITDVNRDRRTVHVHLGKGQKDRMLPIGTRALSWIEAYLSEVRPRLSLDTREKALFLTVYGGPFNPDVLSRMVSKFIKKSKIERSGSSHLFRHTCATHMLEGGADIRFIQQLLGHVKLDTTAIYTEVSIKQLQEVHARCHPAEQKKTLPDAEETS